MVRVFSPKTSLRGAVHSLEDTVPQHHTSKVHHSHIILHCTGTDSVIEMEAFGRWQTN